jgi:hypothetical protein
MRHEIVETLSGTPVVLLDSISTIGPSEAGAVVVSASHGGRISGAFAAKHPPKLVVFNDAGIGKNDAGVASLADLDRLDAPAICVAHTSCRIGDAADAWARGRVSRVNAAAARRGVAEGALLREAVLAFTRDGGA